MSQVTQDAMTGGTSGDEHAVDPQLPAGGRGDFDYDDPSVKPRRRSKQSAAESSKSRDQAPRRSSSTTTESKASNDTRGRRRSSAIVYDEEVDGRDGDFSDGVDESPRTVTRTSQKSSRIRGTSAAANHRRHVEQQRRSQRENLRRSGEDGETTADRQGLEDEDDSDIVEAPRSRRGREDRDEDDRTERRRGREPERSERRRGREDDAADEDVDDEEESEVESRRSSRSDDDRPVRRKGFSEDLMARAERYGFDAEDFENPSGLRRALDRWEEKVAEDGEAIVSEGSQKKNKKAAATEGDSGEETTGSTATDQGRRAGQKESTGDASTGQTVAPKRYFPKLEPKSLNKFNDESKSLVTEVIDGVDELVNKLADENARLRSDLEGVVAGHRQYMQDQFWAEMDDWFDSLEGHEDVFGRGPFDDLTNPEHRENRNGLIRQMGSIRAGNSKHGIPQPSKAKLRQIALRIFSKSFDKLSSTIRDETVRKMQRRQASSMARPSGRQRERELSPDEAAGEFADTFYRERGANIDRYDDRFDDEF